MQSFITKAVTSPRTPRRLFNRARLIRPIREIRFFTNSIQTNLLTRKKYFFMPWEPGECRKDFTISYGIPLSPLPLRNCLKEQFASGTTNSSTSRLITAV